mmetsp:Transcript_8473/g.24030  ORF Transcript_8473/g.24030 Transcript_8473/m.24030 type:complete len:248 (+) Transcript_8473:805-1548(+)
MAPRRTALDSSPLASATEMPDSVREPATTGASVGASVGPGVGVGVGARVGVGVGRGVGACVGCGVGFVVGAEVGALVGGTHLRFSIDDTKTSIETSAVASHASLSTGSEALSASHVPTVNPLPSPAPVMAIVASLCAIWRPEPQSSMARPMANSEDTALLPSMPRLSRSMSMNRQTRSPASISFAPRVPPKVKSESPPVDRSIEHAPSTPPPSRLSHEPEASRLMILSPPLLRAALSSIGSVETAPS